MNAMARVVYGVFDFLNFDPLFFCFSFTEHLELNVKFIHIWLNAPHFTSRRGCASKR